MQMSGMTPPRRLLEAQSAVLRQSWLGNLRLEDYGLSALTSSRRKRSRQDSIHLAQSGSQCLPALTSNQLS